MFSSKSKSFFAFSFVLFLLVLFILPATSVMAQTPLVFTASPGVTISDVTPVVSTITVPTAASIADVNVAVNIGHTHAGDLQLTLTHDDTGTAITLVNRANGPGFAFGCGSNGIVAGFDDSAAIPMDSYDCSVDFESPITGIWKPTVPLSAFNGQSTAGNWTLRIVDILPTDNGVLNSWSVIFNASVPMTEMVELQKVFVPTCNSFSDVENNVIFQFDAPDTVLEGIYCNLITASNRYIRTPGEIGIKEVVDMGVIHAVDVYGPPNSETTAAGSGVCFQGQGNVLFLSAAGIPRQAQPLAASIVGDQTCAVLPTDGTVLLVGNSSGLDIVAGGATLNAARLDPTHRFLDSCRITTNYMLNIRAEPNLDSEVLDMVPYQINLKATERTKDWIRVIYLDFQGWLAADYLDTQGDCKI